MSASAGDSAGAARMYMCACIMQHREEAAEVQTGRFVLPGRRERYIKGHVDSELMSDSCMRARAHGRLTISQHVAHLRRHMHISATARSLRMRCTEDCIVHVMITDCSHS